jgi:hypothetical protein
MTSGRKLHAGPYILVTGGRDYADYAHVKRVLDEERPMVVVQGECPYGGADQLAAKWCEETGTPCIGMRAPWKRFKRGAGPIRNGWMLDFLPIYKVIAFPGGDGTANCIQQAEAREVLVRDERSPSPHVGAR